MRLLLMAPALLLAVWVLLSAAHEAQAQKAATPMPAQPFAPAAITATVQVGPGDSTAFAPAQQVLAVGDGVHWVWSSTSIPHTVTSGACAGLTCTPDGNFDSGLAATAPQSYDFTFTAPGLHPYFCKVHGSSMTGEIFVASTRTFLPLVIR
jgi:plastocyanin